MEMQQCHVLNKYRVFCWCNYFFLFFTLHTCEYWFQQQVWFNITSLFTAQPHYVLTKESVSYWPSSIMSWAAMNTCCMRGVDVFPHYSSSVSVLGTCHLTQELGVCCLLPAGFHRTAHFFHYSPQYLKQLSSLSKCLDFICSKVAAVANTSNCSESRVVVRNYYREVNAEYTVNIDS